VQRETLDNDLEVENYEHNLKMHYEAKRKELDILLSSSIPTQLSNMKTLLWINFLFIGLVLQFIKKFPLPDIIIGFFLFSLLAIIFILFAMLTNRDKSYGVHDDIKLMSQYPDDRWTKSRAIFDMLNTVQISIIDNRNALLNRAHKMHTATFLTLVALIFIILSFSMKQINL